MRKTIWVMPEEKDAVFSLALIERINGVAASLKVKSFSIEISERFISEDNPHFHMKVDFGHVDSPGSGSKLSIDYVASLGKESYEGSIHIEISADSPKEVEKVLVAMAFGLYDEAIREHYQEWLTDYDAGSIILG